MVNTHLKLDEDVYKHLLYLKIKNNSSLYEEVNDLVRLGLEKGDYKYCLSSIESRIEYLEKNIRYIKSLLRQLYSDLDLDSVDIRSSEVMKLFDENYRKKKHVD